MNKNQTRVNECQRLRRKLNSNSDTKRYEKTSSGFLMRLYRNMESRVTGVQKLKYHLYKNKELLSRPDFYAWASSSPSFYILFKEWEESNYNQKLTPTVDRKDSTRGYTLENMEWVTHSENSRRGAINRNKLVRTEIKNIP